MRSSFKVRVYFKRGGIYDFDFTKEEYITEFVNNNARKINKWYLLDENNKEII